MKLISIRNEFSHARRVQRQNITKVVDRAISTWGFSEDLHLDDRIYDLYNVLRLSLLQPKIRRSI